MDNAGAPSPGLVKRIEYGVRLSGYSGFGGALEMETAKLPAGEAAELDRLLEESGILGMNGKYGNLPAISERTITIETTDGKLIECQFDGIPFVGRFAKLKGLFEWLENFIRTEKIDK